VIKPRTPDEVLAGIPGWEGASWRELTGGFTNKTYKVQIDGKAGVLKIDQAVRGEPFNTRPAEASIQSHAARMGLASKVLFVDDLVYLAEYVQGVVWQRASLDEQGNIERLGAALKTLHRLPLTSRSFDAKIAAQRYTQNIDRSDQALTDRCTKIVKSMRLPHDLCCCHNDLVAENIITAPDIRFLDWEYACDNDPLFDLATIVEHHELGEDQVHRLLAAYFVEDGARWRDKLKSQQLLYLALWWLWLASRPGSDSDLLQQVGDRVRATNYS
jgi:thiamine kinase-like enzyme